MRDNRLDFFKGILVIQMIFAHCLQFFCDLGRESIWKNVSEWVNLTTFSGFVFAFGFAYYLAYLQKDFKYAVKKGGKNILVLLGAYYVSAFSYVIFIERIPLRQDRILELLLFQRLAGWSEFLFSFAMLTLVTFILWKPLTHKNSKVLLGIGGLALLVCLLPHREVKPILGTLIGGTGGAYFPVLPFYVYFVAGVYVARKKLNFDKKVLLISIAGTVYMVIDSLFLSRGYPSRFPLSLAWLVGAAFILYCYYLAAGYLSKIKWLSVVSVIGKSSLFYLLLSNFIIFALKSSSFYKIGSGFSIGLCIAILGIGRYLHHTARS
ncbi:uncharacterized protein DUF1624 [Kineothrix alysoides]|uniref:Uncharacterized protein DUF1624 n=1 Tax=Kineothrix alysoides TaxID=1469948 RepID=A0A4R1QKW5_9FIRM|nr:heparan-alpha-glucosaminide N-acetyltransferase domain-containing protein [Kineothrix alysoides]TCL53817.1 uncharacterized protein DUF1624 [Kineothrix alysoides]